MLPVHLLTVQHELDFPVNMWIVGDVHVQQRGVQHTGSLLMGMYTVVDMQALLLPFPDNLLVAVMLNLFPTSRTGRRHLQTGSQMIAMLMSDPFSCMRPKHYMVEK